MKTPIELAREILKAVSCLEGIKKLHYSFTGEKYSLSDMQAVINGHAEQLAHKVIEGEWISVEDMPDKNGNGRLLIYTPSADVVMRYRIIPQDLFAQVAVDATHYKYLSPPKEQE